MGVRGLAYPGPGCSLKTKTVGGEREGASPSARYLDAGGLVHAYKHTFLKRQNRGTTLFSGSRTG